MEGDTLPDEQVPAPAGSSVEDYREIFEVSPDGCLIVDEEGQIVVANARAEELFGYSRDELLRMNVDELVPESLRLQHRILRERFQVAPGRRHMGSGLELRAHRKDGRELPVEIGLSPLRMSTGTFVVATVHDVTDRARLRAFGSGLLQGAEEERQRLARDLHDDTAQSLSALLLRLQMARRTGHPERREELLAEMHGEILRASESVRRILHGLRPPALEEAGVVAAVRAHLRNSLTDSGLNMTLLADPVEELLSREGRLALYRIMQEALSNVVRHANARNLHLRIRARGQAVQATVEDDGRGFSIEEVMSAQRKGLGVLGMQERAIIVGGRVEIESAPGQGTRVQIRIPSPPEHADEPTRAE
jgi:PAS domain S-box-containing protein